MAFLEIRNLSIKVIHNYTKIRICKNLDISLDEGEISSLIGPSHSGKTAIIRAIIGMHGNDMRVKFDHFSIDDINITNYTTKERRKLLSKYISLIFQKGRESLSPRKTILKQMQEAISYKSFSEPWYKIFNWKKNFASTLLHKVGIKEPKNIFNCYPNELSEVLCQKIVIAMALASKPKIIIADDPIDSMTPFTQLQILHLLDSLNKNNQVTILYIANKINSIANFVDYINIYYCGNIVESGPRQSIINTPHHPYTESLLDITKSINDKDNKSELGDLKGFYPNLTQIPNGCTLGPRCPYADRECNKAPPTTRYKNVSFKCHFPRNMDKGE